MATFTSKQDKLDLRTRAKLWATRNEDAIETACDLGILGLSAALATICLYNLGVSRGFSRGLKTGYSVGVIEGEHNVLSKMAMTVVDKAKEVM